MLPAERNGRWRLLSDRGRTISNSAISATIDTGADEFAVARPYWVVSALRSPALFAPFWLVCPAANGAGAAPAAATAE